MGELTGAPNRVLMVAFHFPPCFGSSGIQRAVGFCKHLPEFGWTPIVLSARQSAYELVSEEILDATPRDLQVWRAPALDAARHLSVFGRFPGFLAEPDRWASWFPGGVLAGLAAIRRLRPRAIWSTYPIPTAHLIARTLARLSGLPWIADFRDPMAQDGYPATARLWRMFERIERRTVLSASRCVFVAPSALESYMGRYPSRADRMALIENGYDEQAFCGLECGEPLNRGFLTLLHSGIVYPEERNPAALFAALGQLKREEPEVAARLRVRFRAPVHGELLRQHAHANGVMEMVQILPPIEYRAALQEMLSADGLMILQAGCCDQQIPAKIYEYLRTRRPILGFVGLNGDTAKILTRAAIDTVSALDDEQSIRRMLRGFVSSSGRTAVALEEVIDSSSRTARTRQLSELLQEALE